MWNPAKTKCGNLIRLQHILSYNYDKLVCNIGKDNQVWLQLRYSQQKSMKPHINVLKQPQYIHWVTLLPKVLTHNSHLVLSRLLSEMQTIFINPPLTLRSYLVYSCLHSRAGRAQVHRWVWALVSPERTGLLRTGRGRTLGRVGPRGEEEPRAVDTTQTAQTLIWRSSTKITFNLTQFIQSFLLVSSTVSLWAK